MDTQSKTKRGKRGAPYRIRWGLGVTSVTATEWKRAIADGWIVAETGKTAVLAKGIIARLRDGVLWLRNLAAKTSAWIYTSWIGIERQSPVIQGEYYRRAIQQDHCGPRVVVKEPKGTWMDRCDWARTLEGA